MPYEAEKITEGKNKGKYKVKNKQTGKVHAKATSKSNAMKQMRLMLASEHGWTPTGAK